MQINSQVEFDTYTQNKSLDTFFNKLKKTDLS